MVYCAALLTLCDLHRHRSFESSRIRHQFWEVNRRGLRHGLESRWFRKEWASSALLPATVELGMAGKPIRPESGRAHKALADRSCPLPPNLESTADGEANRPETGGSFGMGVRFAYSPPS